MGLKRIIVPAILCGLLLQPGAGAHEKDKKAERKTGPTQVVPAEVLTGIPHTVIRKQGYDIRV